MTTAIARRREPDRRSGRSAPVRAARRSGYLLARLVNLVVSLVAGVLVLGIILVVLKANPDNVLVDAVLDAGRFLAGPFKDIFSFDDHKLEVAVNWGIAAVVYSMAGALIVRLLRR